MKMRRLLSHIVAVICMASAFAPALALASEGEKGGVPQLDTSFYPGQIFWLVISFTTLYVLMAFVALPRVKRTQKNRHQVIGAELSAASASNELARQMVAQYEGALAEARAKAQATISAIAADQAKEASAQQAAQQQELNKHLQDSEAKIRSTRDAALKEVSASAGELAQGIIEKVTGKRAGA